MRRLAHATVGLAGLIFSAALAAGLIGGQTTADANPILEAGVSVDAYGFDSGDTYSAEGGELSDLVSEPGSRSESAGASPTVVYRICRVTAYSDRGITASGVPVGVGQCAAPADIPFGARVYIPALGRTFIVTDRTHRRFRRSTVDIFIPSTKQCRQFGCRFLECEITLPTQALTKQRG